MTAAKRFDPESGRVTVVDSRTASLGQGLLVVRGVELAAGAWRPGAIVRESGRVGRGRAWLGTKLNLKHLYQNEDGTKAEAGGYD